MIRNATFVRIGNAVVIAALGLWYLEALKYFLSVGIDFLPEPSTSLQKMVLTGSSASVACLSVFLANRYLTRQRMLPVGAASALITFCWYYVWRAEAGVISHIIGVLMTSYSAFAMAVFVALPLLVGWLLRKTKGMEGLAWLVDSVLRRPV